MSRIKKILSTSWKYLSRNSGLVFSTIVTVFLTFFITTIFSSLFFGAQLFTNALEQKIGLVIFFKEKTDESYILNVKASLEKHNPKLNIEYKSKEVVYQEFIKQFGKDVLFTTEEEMTPALKINAQNIDDVRWAYNKIINDQDIMSRVSSYKYIEAAVNILEKAASGIFWGGIALSALLITSSFIIISITTNRAIQEHTDEIKTMQLIGADRGYICWPFVIVGTFCSTIGVLLSILVITVVALFVYRSLLDSGVITLFRNLFFSGVVLPQIQWWKYVIAGVIKVAIGGAMGAISSFIAVKKRLKW